MKYMNTEDSLPVFSFKGIAPLWDNEKSGTITCPNRSTAKMNLQSMGMTDIKLALLRKPLTYTQLISISKTIPLFIIEEFVERFINHIEEDHTIISCLITCSKETTDSSLDIIIDDITSGVETGDSFMTMIQKYSHCFSYAQADRLERCLENNF